MTYTTGSWGEEAKARSRRRHSYFMERLRQTPIEKRRARQNLVWAVRTGKITRPDTCQNCGRKTRVQGHHDDYTKQLDVKWYCGSCHRKLHRGGDE